jgi:hypothetical protein
MQGEIEAVASLLSDKSQTGCRDKRKVYGRSIVVHRRRPHSSLQLQGR